ncbi:hypothetical protein KGY79_13885 [Candidatus Bipolaricaulota bacterium]|nr:hypothetical protein [Candidatus Bipolaricaulota bacterium]
MEANNGGTRRKNGFLISWLRHWFCAYTTDYEKLEVLSRGPVFYYWLGLSATSFVLIFSILCDLSDLTVKNGSIVTPVLYKTFLPNLAFWIPLFAITVLIADKQRCYYYDMERCSSSKRGLFENKIKKATRIEWALDGLLVGVPAFMIGFSLLPSLWYALFGLYSFLVMMRSYIVLKRPRYEDLFEGKKPYFCSEDWLEEKYRPEKYDNKTMSELRSILSGWVLSHFLYTLWGAILFICLLFLAGPNSLQARMIFWASLPALLLFYRLVTPKISQRYGQKAYSIFRKLPL